MTRLEPPAGQIKLTIQPLDEQKDHLEKLLESSGLTAGAVTGFFINRLAAPAGEVGASVDDWRLEQYKPQTPQEASTIDFLRNSRREIASLNDDDLLFDRSLTLKDMEQFKLKYDGTYKTNLNQLGALKQMFTASLPELDKNRDGLLTQVELQEGLSSPAVSKSSRAYAAFLVSEFSKLSSSYGVSKRVPGFRAIGGSDFERKISTYDFEKAKLKASRGALNLLGVMSPVWAAPLLFFGVTATAPAIAAVGGLTVVGVGLGYSWMRRNALNSFAENRLDTARMLRSAETRGLFEYR